LPNDERPAVGEREELETEFGRILDAAIDPLLEMCRRMADLRGEKGGAWERAVFLANCVGYLEVRPFLHALFHVDPVERKSLD
jgi:hypothetical protein